jgi:hypothetical protein
MQSVLPVFEPGTSIPGTGHFFFLFFFSCFSFFLLFCSELWIVNTGKVSRKVCVHSMGAVAWFWHGSGMLRHRTARSGWPSTVNLATSN